MMSDRIGDERLMLFCFLVCRVLVVYIPAMHGMIHRLVLNWLGSGFDIIFRMMVV